MSIKRHLSFQPNPNARKEFQAFYARLPGTGVSGIRHASDGQKANQPSDIKPHKLP